ncbi:disintegrin and metalloproteinase domain-containing protein 10 isoform X1 [Schistocerca americana]|uniref:disintegrin and metalloproteinase domain-containing protein 10 isoform X1 n=1 Tax=Schistocerca americana TaxID=7009 RepID=UPI001F4F48B3|nr:disintegrin and metalloproteinase domain-containing protein 10 isoform X1 [Schistocerca americana]
MFSECGYVIFILLLAPYIESAERLNEYISRYEPLSYDRAEVHRAHSRARRSAPRPGVHPLSIEFEARGRRFPLRLRRDTAAFSDRLQVLGSAGQPLHVDTAHLYHGHLAGEPKSHVFGSVIDGVFEGKIYSPSDGAFYVEKAHHFFPSGHNDSIHSVIYHEADVEDPYESQRTGHVGGCGITDDVVQWMDRVQNSADEEEPEPPPPPPSPPRGQTRSSWEEQGADAYQKYSREANEGSGGGSRTKRATRPKEDNRNTCSLFIQTDPLIWRHISETVNGDAEKTREEILSLIAHHVTAVNYIYRDTKFDGNVEHRNIKFEVQRIKIDDDAPCQPGWRGDPNQFCMENIDVSNFLNLHSLGNHEDFCLAYVFTYRDFTGGTLGLAWVASASGASGGICEKFKTYTETIGGLYHSTKRSLNTGIITFVNYNSRVPPKVSQLTLAHEIGHNFGSPHDYPAECRPGGLNGNFIMFASATSGDRPNNSKFSSCSIGNISKVLDAIEDNKKRNCFTASEGAFCGNKIVEIGEECDCGYDDDECTDKCCYPRQVSEVDRIKNESAKGCYRRAGTQCSPSQGPCCSSETCQFVLSRQNVLCRSESDCSWSSKCSGSSPECPAPMPKANKTRCNEGTQLCINGECTGSICLEWNMTECFLSSGTDKRRLCELACQNGTDAATCRSTSEFAAAVGLPPGGISLRPGSPCDNFQGYCDVFYKCRAVDAEGPLARLKNLLFNKETLLTVAQWITEYWWAVLLMGVAFIIFMGLFIKCCAVHTPSSNPKKPPARRFSETLRHPMSTLRRMRGPPAGLPVGSHHPAQLRSGPSGHSRAPAHGYGEGRGQYYAPKASAPPANYSRGADMYAGAYGGRSNAFEMRHHKV